MRSGRRASQWSVITALIALSLGGGTGSVFGQGADEPQIAVTPAQIDFGDQDIDNGLTATRSVTITNIGTTDLIITGASLSGLNASDFLITSSVGGPVLAPGASGEVRVAFNPSAPGPKSAALDISSNDPDDPVASVALSGRGTDQEIEIAPAMLDFADWDISAQHSPPASVTISNVGTAPLRVFDVSLAGVDSPDFLILAVTGHSTLAPGESGAVYLAFDPSSVGPKSADLLVASDDTDEPTLPVKLDGLATDREIDVAPTTVILGTRDIDAGPSPAATVTISNAGTTPLSIQAVELVGPEASEFAVASDTGEATLDGGAQRQVQVTFDPSSLGVKVATLAVSSDDSDDPSVEVLLGGAGVDPEIEVAPLAADFGSRDIDNGPTHAVAITIVNLGTSPLTISDLSFDGSDPDQFRFQRVLGGPSLAPGASAEVDVVFDPDSTGTKTSEVVISSDDDDEPSVEVALTGVGTDQEIGVAPLLLEFGEWNFGTVPTPARTVTIVNAGTAPLLITSLALSGLDAAEFSILRSSGGPVLGPNESAEAQVTFVPMSSGEKTANLTIASDDTDEPIVNVALRGTGTGTPQEIDLTPLAHNFGAWDVDDGPTASTTVNITNQGTALLRISGVALSGPDAVDFVILGSSGGPALGFGETGQVRVAFDPQSVGAKTANLVISSNDEDEPSVSVALSGTGIDQEIDALPVALDFGSQRVEIGPTPPQTVRISNLGTANLHLRSVSLTGSAASDFAITRMSGSPTLVPGASAEVQVIFDPASVGIRLAHLSIVSDDTDEPVLDVPLSGVATDLVISVEPILLDLGDRDIDEGATEPRPVTITNLGTIMLTIYSVTLTGPDAAQFTIASISGGTALAPGASREVQIAFDPESLGLSEASLRIESDRPPVLVLLRGVGTQTTAELIDFLLGRRVVPQNLDQVDVNGDGVFDVADIVANTRSDR